MTPRVVRLTQRSDFVHAANHGHKWATPGLVLQFVKTRHLNPTDAIRKNGQMKFRIGFTATRRIGGAVVRNRAKRRLREVAARVMPKHAKVGYDYVLIARAATTQRSFHNLIGDLTKALAKVT